MPVYIVLIANLVNRIGSAVFLFLSIYLHMHLHFSLEEIGIILGFYGGGCLLGSFFGGILSDKIAPIFILIISLWVSSFIFVVLPFMQGYYCFIFILFLLGFFIAMGQPAMSLLLNTCVDRKNSDKSRLKIFGLYRVTNNIGISITGILGGILASEHFAYLFYLDGVTSCLAGFLLLFSGVYLKNKANHLNHQQTDSECSFKSIITDKYFMCLWGILLLVLLIFSQITTVFPLYLHEYYELRAQNIGYIFGLNGLLIMFFQVPISNKISHFNLPKVASIGILCIGIGLGILCLSTSFFVALLSCLMWTLGEMLFFPTVMTLVFNHTDNMHRGKYMSIYELAFSISTLFFPFCGMFLYQQMGGDNLWILFLGMSFFAAVIFTRVIIKLL